MRCLIAAVLLMALSTMAAAQDAPDPRRWTEEFMQTLIDEGAEAAHQKLRDSHVGENRPHAVVAVLENMQRAEKAFGKALDYEFVTERKVGESLIVLGYLNKREISPVLWTFVLYSPYPRKWRLLTFSLIGDPQVGKGNWLDLFGQSGSSD